MSKKDPTRAQIEALHGMGPGWLDVFLTDLADIAGCREAILDLLRAYADVSKGACPFQAAMISARP